MKKLLLTIMIVAAGLCPVLAQEEADTLVGWRTMGDVGLNFSQSSFSNWVGGGQNTIALTSFFNLNVKYKRDKVEWENFVNLAYGVNRRQDEGNRKIEDKIDLTSKLGYQLSSKWFLSGLLNFKSQFAPGFNYPNDSVKISDWLAPGYITVSAGFDYKPNAVFSVMLSPLTGKFTFVMDETLSNQGAFGVDPGESTRAEIGGYIKLLYQKDIFENVNLLSKAEFFSNYINNPENIDVFWDTTINMKVNSFLSANVAVTLIYDDDILIDKNGDGTATTPGLQFKQVLAVGLSYKFGP